MEDEKQGAQGAEDTGASGTQSTPAEESTRSINSQAKELPWVQDALKAKAELAKLKQSQADAETKAKQEQLKAAGDFEAALEIERKKYKELETKYQSETKMLQLRAEFAAAGIKDLRAVSIFANDYQPESGSAADFVASIKKDPQNALYFSDPNQRVSHDPPPASGGGNPDGFDPEKNLEEWRHSKDPKKRARAIQYSREQIERKARKHQR